MSIILSVELRPHYRNFDIVPNFCLTCKTAERWRQSLFHMTFRAIHTRAHEIKICIDAVYAGAAVVDWYLCIYPP